MIKSHKIHVYDGQVTSKLPTHQLLMQAEKLLGEAVKDYSSYSGWMKYTSSTSHERYFRERSQALEGLLTVANCVKWLADKEAQERLSYEKQATLVSTW